MSTSNTTRLMRCALAGLSLIGLLACGIACGKDKVIGSALERPTDLPRPPGNRLPSDLRPPR